MISLCFSLYVLLPSWGGVLSGVVQSLNIYYRGATLHSRWRSGIVLKSWKTRIPKTFTPHAPTTLTWLTAYWEYLVLSKDSVRQDATRNEAELIRSLQNNWQALTTSVNLEQFFNTLIHRYNECVRWKEKDFLISPFKIHGHIDRNENYIYI